MKRFSLLLALTIIFSGIVKGQLRCGTEEIDNGLKAANPQIAVVEAQLEQEIQQQILHNRIGQFAKGTEVNTDTIYHIPIVFHIVHDYGEEYITDDQVYAVVDDMNHMFSRSNADSIGIISTYNGFIPGTNIIYRGKANIHFDLATKDPQGNPTHGITRHHSWVTNKAGDQSKLDLWPTGSYLNIWVVHTLVSQLASYAYLPATTTTNPYIDGIIATSQPSIGNNINVNHDITHQVGHYLNLFHTYNGTINNPQTGCGDDGVDDTPPTTGHFFGCAQKLYDTTCATGYSKSYTAAQSLALFGDTSHHFIDYPDTANTQNVMDESYCAKMFTYGQILRMRATLNSTVANRNNLKSPTNLVMTGALAPRMDLRPIADFNVLRPFICADGSAMTTFYNKSWNDTIVHATWTFSNGASTPIADSLANLLNSFSQPGWVTVTLAVTGNGSGSDTITKKKALYVADTTQIDPDYYVMSFEDSAAASKWPIFDYYGSDHKWEIVNTAGVDNNHSIRFDNFDARPFPPSQSNFTGTPGGVFADFYSPAFDLSNVPLDSRLTFAYSGAYRTTNTSEMNDMLAISYSNNCGYNWRPLDTISGAGIGAGGGYVYTPYTPNSNQWSWHGTVLESIAGEPQIFFRFRFITGTDNATNLYGTGNNFYIDRININNYPLGVDPRELEAVGMAVSPNPTTGNAIVIIKGPGYGTAQIRVTDMTGKLVYNTDTHLSGATKVVIPADPISRAGIYLVEVITDGKVTTQKLVVY